MHAIRAFFLAHRSLALALVALALAMKVLVPAGFMPVAAGKTITVMVCDGHGGEQSRAIALGDNGESGIAKAAKTCPFSVLSSASLGTVDIVLAAALLLFILASSLLPITTPPLRRIGYLTPPSCGPPAHA